MCVCACACVQALVCVLSLRVCVCTCVCAGTCLFSVPSCVCVHVQAHVCVCVCVHVPVSDSFNSKIITRSHYSTIYLIHQYLLSDYSMPHTIHVTLYDYIILALHKLYEIATV